MAQGLRASGGHATLGAVPPDNVGTPRRVELSLSPWLGVALLAAITLLGRALQLGNGTLSPRSFPWFVAAALGAAASVPLMHVRGASQGAQRSLGLLALAAVTVSFAQLSSAAPAHALRGKGNVLPEFFGLISAAGVLAGAGAFAQRRLRSLPGVVIVALWSSAALWVVERSPAPPIDVRIFQHDAASALLEGSNPYDLTFPNIYGHTRYYAQELVSGRRLQFGFPYPPVPLLLALPGVWLDDVRYAHIAALALSALLLVLCVRGPMALVAATLILFTPRAFFVIEQTWTEPVSVLLLACTLATALRAPRWSSVPLGLLLASKQYFWLLLPLSVLLAPDPSWRARGRFVAMTATVALATALPFLLWDPGAFFHSVVQVHLLQPFRAESLSFSAWLVQRGSEPLPPLLAPLLAFALASVLALRLRPSPTAFSLATALSLLTLFALGKQAFCNYYFMVIAALASALATLRSTKPSLPAQRLRSSAASATRAPRTHPAPHAR